MRIAGPVDTDLRVVSDEAIRRAVSADWQRRVEPDAEGEAIVVGLFGDLPADDAEAVFDAAMEVLDDGEAGAGVAAGLVANCECDDGATAGAEAGRVGGVELAAGAVVSAFDSWAVRA
ncbi:MAG: hypothetical protein PF961_08775 [Planctomycetota bacterium]|nr:hypothetical protein [Planctomycetota bacterium]